MTEPPSAASQHLNISIHSTTSSNSSSSSRDIRSRFYSNLGIEGSGSLLQRPLETLLDRAAVHPGGLLAAAASVLSTVTQTPTEAEILTQLREMCAAIWSSSQSSPSEAKQLAALPSRWRTQLWRIFLGYMGLHNRNWEFVDEQWFEKFDDLAETTTALCGADEASCTAAVLLRETRARSDAVFTPSSFGSSLSAASSTSSIGSIEISDTSGAVNILHPVDEDEYESERQRKERFVSLCGRIHLLQIHIEGNEKESQAAFDLLMDMSGQSPSAVVHAAPLLPSNTAMPRAARQLFPSEDQPKTKRSLDVQSVFEEFDRQFLSKPSTSWFRQAVAASQAPQPIVSSSPLPSTFNISRGFSTSGSPSPSKSLQSTVMYSQIREQRKRELDLKLSILRVMLDVFDWQPQASSSKSVAAAKTTGNGESEIRHSTLYSMPSISAFWCWYLLLERYREQDVPSRSWREAVHSFINDMNRQCMQQMPDLYNVLFVVTAGSIPAGNSGMQLGKSAAGSLGTAAGSELALERKRQLDAVFESWFGSLFCRHLSVNNAIRLLDFLIVHHDADILQHIGLAFLSTLRRPIVRVRAEFDQVLRYLLRLNDVDLDSVLVEAKRFKMQVSQK